MTTNSAEFSAEWTFRPVKRIEAREMGVGPQEIEPLRDKAHYGTVVTEDVWIESPFADNWVAAYRLAAQDGQPVIAEVRVFPREDHRRHFGEWSGVLQGVHARVPPGGLTARHLRRIRLGSALLFGKDTIHWFATRDPKGASRARKAAKEPDQRSATAILVADLGFRSARSPRSASRKGRKRGRPGRSAQELARIARAYVRRLEVGSLRPIADVATRYSLERSVVRDVLHRARQQGLLSKALSAGRAGGQLTPQARELLRGRKRKE